MRLISHRLAPAVAWIVLAAVATAAAQTSAPVDPLDDLVKMFQDPAKAAAVLTALRATDDKDLAPFYKALAASGNKDWRLFSIGALADAAGKDAAATFSDRLKNDPSMVVRTEALLAMIALKVGSDDELTAAMNAPDENLQCIAARTLIQKDASRDAALKALEKLTASKDTATAALARMSLLGQGRKDQLDPLRAMMKDPQTPSDVLAIMLEQVGEEKIAPAAELMEMVIASDQPWQLKLRAHRSLSAISDKPPRLLLDAIATADQTVFRVHLTRALALRSDSAAAIEELAKGEGVVAAVARFEKARPAGGDAASKAALDAVRLAHPVVLDYVLDRARQDLKERPAECDFYVPALVNVVESVNADPQDIKQEHFKATRAGTILADLGSPRAIDQIKKILQGKYTAVTRVMATGMLRSTNPAMCDVARPLLDSPYGELSMDAALLLGRLGDKGASGALRAVTDNPQKNSILLVVMADWYRLKIDGRSKAAAEALAKAVK